MSRGKPNIRSCFTVVVSYNEQFDTESRLFYIYRDLVNSKRKVNKSLMCNLILSAQLIIVITGIIKKHECFVSF